MDKEMQAANAKLLESVFMVEHLYVKRPGVSLWDATYAVAQYTGGRVLGVSPHYGLVEAPGLGDVMVYAK